MNLSFSYNLFWVTSWTKRVEKEKQDFVCNKYETESLHFIKNLNLPVLIPDEEKKAFIKPFEAPERRAKIKI